MKSVKERGMFGFVHLSSLTEKGKDKLNLIEREHTCVPGVCMRMCAHAHTHTQAQKKIIIIKTRSSSCLRCPQEPGRYRSLLVGWAMPNAYRVSGDLGNRQLQLSFRGTCEITPFSKDVQIYK